MGSGRVRPPMVLQIDYGNVSLLLLGASCKQGRTDVQYSSLAFLPLRQALRAWDGLWVIGLSIGSDLIFNGWSLVMLGLAARRLPEPSPQQ